MLGEIYVRMVPDSETPYFHFWWPLWITQTTCMGLDAFAISMPPGFSKEGVPDIVQVLTALQLEAGKLQIALLDRVFVERDNDWFCLGDGMAYLPLVEHLSMYLKYEPLKGLPWSRFRVWMPETLRIQPFKQVSGKIYSLASLARPVWA